MAKADIPWEEYNVIFYKKVGTRKANALSKLSFVGLASIADGTVKHLRIAFGAVAPTIVREEKIENMAIGQGVAVRTQLLPQLADSYSALIQPIDDQRSTARYRKVVSLNLLEQFIREYIS